MEAASPAAAEGGHAFPTGPGGVCHPLNVAGFNLQHPACGGLYRASAQSWPMHVDAWEGEVAAHARLARQAWNCSSVQACGLAKLLLTFGQHLCPGFRASASAKQDRFQGALHARLATRMRDARTRELRGLFGALRAEIRQAEDGPRAARPVAPGLVTLGIHADRASAAGPWRGQLELWRAYAMTHGLRWRLDTERYFDGAVFAKYGDLFWASASGSEGGFWEGLPYLTPHESGRVPQASWSHALLGDPRLLRGLAVFTQPPPMWDSLEALWAVLPENAWTIWMDFDLTISPCCFHEFSLLELINGWGRDAADADLPHVIFRDSPREDFMHHCANAGFLVVRNSAVGRLFLELARQKRRWPSIPYGYQGALAESLLELLGLEGEMGGRRGGGGGPEYSSGCLPYLVLGKVSGHTGYADFCWCWRNELRRLVGDIGGRVSSWVRFLEPRRGPETGLLLASLFIFRSGSESQHAQHLAEEDRIRGVGFLPLTTWGRERHRAYLEAWLTPDERVGGPCALLPLMLHWASLPHRPGLLYDFLHRRFPRELPLEVLVNGSAAQLAAAYAAAGASGLAAFQARFASRQPPSDVLAKRMQRSACNLGSAHLWASGGFTEAGHSTSPYGPHRGG